MMKKMTLILTTVLIIFCCSVDSSAAKKYVFDKSDLLSNSAIEQLEEDANLYSTSDEYGFDMVVVTTDDSEGKTATEYADDYY
ncbi:MAG: TPM domain-containing protein, partial [Intestinibacter sp.]|uniref:TPM domain-containing protein n=1 Tax=Intestinibacter sp. TaxID=1965304 RepID=UPI003F18B2F4